MALHPLCRHGRLGRCGIKSSVAMKHYRQALPCEDWVDRAKADAARLDILAIRSYPVRVVADFDPAILCVDLHHTTQALSGVDIVNSGTASVVVGVEHH